MTKFRYSIFALAVLFFLSLTGAEAAEIRSANCKKIFKDFKESTPISAFALSKNGYACGRSFKFSNAEAASKRALLECRKRKRGPCKIIKISNAATKPTSKECRKSLKDWQGFAGFKAFAITGNGQHCGWASKGYSKQYVVEQALRACKERGKGCHIIAFEDSITAADKNIAVRSGQEWVEKNLKSPTLEKVSRLQRDLLRQDCGPVTVDGKLGRQTFAAVGKCYGGSKEKQPASTPQTARSLGNENTKLTFRFRSVDALIDSLDRARIAVNHRRAIRRELSRVLRKADYATRPKTAFVRMKANRTGQPKPPEIGSLTIDLGEAEKLVLYPSLKGDEVSYWSLAPSSNTVTLNSQKQPAASETAEILAKAALSPAEKRIALVIGNNAYKSVQPLENPLNDASDMSAALKALKFEVTLLKDGGRLAMEDHLAAFARQARDADTAVVFYAGHAIQHEGINYLIPVDVELKDESDVRRLIRVQDVIRDLQNSKGARILFLDACRDNEAVQQLARSGGLTRSTGNQRGLVRERADGVMITYSTQPGKVAADGENSRNSPFTAALLKHIKTPDVGIRRMLARVRADVHAATEGDQLPETSDSMIGEFAFAAR